MRKSDLSSGSAPDHPFPSCLRNALGREVVVGGTVFILCLGSSVKCRKHCCFLMLFGEFFLVLIVLEVNSAYPVVGLRV